MLGLFFKPRKWVAEPSNTLDRNEADPGCHYLNYFDVCDAEWPSILLLGFLLYLMDRIQALLGYGSFFFFLLLCLVIFVE